MTGDSGALQSGRGGGTEDPLLRTGCFDNVIADDDPDTTCSRSSTVTLGVA